MFTPADLCINESINFILGHALYVKAIHGGNSFAVTLASFQYNYQVEIVLSYLRSGLISALEVVSVLAIRKPVKLYPVAD